MADLARYGRRKQKNPQRKNVENEDNMGETTTLGTDGKGDLKTDCTSVKTEQHCHDDKENCNHDTNQSRSEEQNNNNNSSQLKIKVEDSNQSSTTVPGPVKEGETPVKCEEDKIKELLERGDTAVIFPEPVSDHEDDNGSHTGDSVSNTDDEVCLKCAHCQQGFSRINLLRDHMKTYHADKPIKYSCPKCDESFVLKSQLDKHLACHSPTSQLCRVCHKSFANVYRLQRHMISHDESTDLRKFKCPECGKAFKFKHHLKEHIRIHSGEKPFECSNCGKRFSHSGSYSSHMTSKKCWVMNMKGRRVDRNGNMESISYANSPKQQAAITSTELPIQTSFATQFVHFDPRNPTSAVPAYFSPSLNGSFIPYTVYSPKQPPSSVIYTPTPNGGLPQSQLSPDKKTDLIPSLADKKLAEAIRKEIALVCSAESVRVVEKLKSSSEAVSPDSSGVKEDRDTGSPDRTEGDPTENQCKHCHSTFKSPVDLHQHERYLCKLNKDIIHRVSQIESGLNSPSSTTSSDFSKVDTSNGSIDGVTDDEDAVDSKEESLENRKLRMRSMITDEQLQVLKAHYQVNPRPRKFELIRIGNEIGFPKRVVQVWFQNMRARDRKKGKNVPYFPSMARFKRQEEGSVTPSKVPSPYIPVVPQPYNGSMHPATSVVLSTAGSFPVQDQSKTNGKYVQPATHSSPKPYCPSRQQDEPLDLTVKRSPPQAHGGSRSRSQTSSPPSVSESEGEVLNLSQKPSSSFRELPLNVPVPRPRTETGFQNSAIYKYMQQEGMIINRPGTLPSSMSNGNIPRTSPILTSCGLVPKSEIHQGSPQRLSSTTGEEGEEDRVTASETYRDDDTDTQGELVIDERTNENTDDSECEERLRNRMDEDDRSGLDEEDSEEDSEEDEEGEEGAPMNHSLDGTGDPDRKSKRTRKKSWRQVEAEELQLDFEESLSVDEDQPHRKKRRSWKNHKVDVEEGMYACDQCEKMFSKQSSLARHKYEHSGARPFNCDVCSKAFKHKHHLTEHKRLHSGEKPFQCRKCGKRFSHSGSYSQHMNHRYKYCKPNGGDDSDTLGEGPEVKPCDRMLVFA
ncbi:zinc finger E-box-binding homeobox 2-like isoform X2 [Liolophura sinensis]|uniref:zinc finger E-box-binding homeobox 2-like isoform X2 n=1 Tax=Liolophura sinensis TaxID=3198878 RepID=UPI0031598AD1